jgi:transcription-repair coupling factor (superfamily II helicase)
LQIQYKDLGLLIVDEEQRFGVRHKERIKTLKHNVDVLTSLWRTPNRCSSSTINSPKSLYCISLLSNLCVPTTVEIQLMSRFRTPKEIKQTKEGLKTGFVDIVVGTHNSPKSLYCISLLSNLCVPTTMSTNPVLSPSLVCFISLGVLNIMRR